MPLAHRLPIVVLTLIALSASPVAAAEDWLSQTLNQNCATNTRRQCLDQLIQLKPNHAIAYATRANLKAKSGDTAGAKQDQTTANQITTKLLGQSPTTAQGWFERATFIYRDGAQDIVADLSQAIRLQPDYAEAYLQRGEMGWLEGTLENTRDSKAKMQAAIADYSKFIQLKPGSAHLAYPKRAQLLTKIGNFQAAIADYNALISTQPNAQAYQERAALREKIKDDAGAIGDLTAAIKLDSNQPQLYFQRGQRYAQQGQSKPAIADFTAALQIKQQSSGKENRSALYQARGYAQFKLGENESAVADFTAAISHNPENIQAYLLRGDTLAKMQIRDRSIADYQKAADLLKQRSEGSYGPHKAFFQASYQRQLSVIKQIAIKLSAIEQPSPAKPAQTGEDFLNQGLKLVDRGDFSNAASAFTQAIQLNPNLVDAYVYRAALMMFAESDYDSLHESRYQPGTIADLTQAIQIQPKRVDLYGLRATAYQVNSDYPKALADVNRAIALAPKDLDLYLQRQRIHLVLGDAAAEKLDVVEIRRIEASRRKP